MTHKLRKNTKKVCCKLPQKKHYSHPQTLNTSHRGTGPHQCILQILLGKPTATVACMIKIKCQKKGNLTCGV